MAKRRHCDEAVCLLLLVRCLLSNHFMLEVKAAQQEGEISEECFQKVRSLALRSYQLIKEMEQPFEGI